MKNWIRWTAILVVAAGSTAFLSGLFRPLTSREQFDHIQIGMSVGDVDWIMEPWNLVDLTLTELLGTDYTGELGYQNGISLEFERGRVTQKRWAGVADRQ
jgi:hypothetical protein